MGAFELCLHHSRRRCADPRCANQQAWRLLHLATAARAPDYRVYDRSSGQMWRGLQTRAVQAGEWRQNGSGTRWNARTNEWNTLTQVGAQVALVEWDFPSPLFLGWRVPGRS